MDAKNLTLGEKYDLEHFSRKEDIGFWLEAADLYGSPILDIGSGTGRISIPLAKVGYEVYSLDKAGFMLERLKNKIKPLPKKIRKNIKCFEGDMRDFNFGVEFPLLICTFNTFLNMLTLRDRERFLLNAFKHLKPDGRLILDIVNPNKGNLKPTVKWRLEKTNTLPDGRISKRFYRHLSHDRKKKVLMIEFHTILFTKEGKRETEWSFNYTTACLEHSYVASLLESMGFVIEKVFGDYFGNSYITLPDPEVQIIVCKKRGEHE